ERDWRVRLRASRWSRFRVRGRATAITVRRDASSRIPRRYAADAGPGGSGRGRARHGAQVRDRHGRMRVAADGEELMMRSGRRQVSADVAVIGLGAMGSAAAYHLASRGLKVVGLDRHAPPHTLGSTHGRSRIIREAIFEHPRYVPFVRRAYELWFELEKESGEQLFHRTGGLMIGQPDGVLVQGARASAEAHGVPYEMLSSVEVRRRFPAYAPPDDSVAFLE